MPLEEGAFTLALLLCGAHLCLFESVGLDLASLRHAIDA
ncbi:MAG: hypothetical protein ACI9A1_000213, partial [Lentimonas sp.]